MHHIRIFIAYLARLVCIEDGLHYTWIDDFAFSSPIDALLCL